MVLEALGRVVVFPEALVALVVVVEGLAAVPVVGALDAEVVVRLFGKFAVTVAALDYLHSRPEVRKEPFALIGFSMGAAWSLVLASEYPEDFRKVVLFYGIGDADFAKIKAEILGHVSDSDEWEPLDGIRAMEKDMRAAGLNPSFHIYPNKSHWFFETDRPEYDPEAAELAWTRTLEFLHK